MDEQLVKSSEFIFSLEHRLARETVNKLLGTIPIWFQSSGTGLENFNKVDQIFINQNCILRQFAAVKLHIYQQVVQQVLRYNHVVFCQFYDKRSFCDLTLPQLVAF